MCASTDMGGGRVQARVDGGVEAGDHGLDRGRARRQRGQDLGLARAAVVGIGLDERRDLADGRAVGRPQGVEPRARTFSRLAK
jgi:hypothetical protein